MISEVTVKYLASDPTLNTSTEGQVWYNSTEGVLKSLVQIKAWSAGGNLPSARLGNASANASMLSINRRMGFNIIFHRYDFNLKIDEIERKLFGERGIL